MSTPPTLSIGYGTPLPFFEEITPCVVGSKERAPSCCCWTVLTTRRRHTVGGRASAADCVLYERPVNGALSQTRGKTRRREIGHHRAASDWHRPTEMESSSGERACGRPALLLDARRCMHGLGFRDRPRRIFPFRAAINWRLGIVYRTTWRPPAACTAVHAAN